MYEVSQARVDAAGRADLAGKAEVITACVGFFIGNPWLATTLVGINPLIGVPLLVGLVAAEYYLGMQAKKNFNRRDLLRSPYIDNNDERVQPLKPIYQKVVNKGRRLRGRQ